MAPTATFSTEVERSDHSVYRSYTHRYDIDRLECADFSSLEIQSQIYLHLTKFSNTSLANLVAQIQISSAVEEPRVHEYSNMESRQQVM